jgi:signal transduction histidine kinase
MHERTLMHFIRYIFNKLSVGQKIMIVIVVEILSYSTITATAIYQIHLMGNEIRQMANTYIPLLSATTSIRHQVQDERVHFKDILFAGDRVVYDKESEQTYIVARNSYNAASAKISELITYSEEMVAEAMDGNDGRVLVLEGSAPRLLQKLKQIREAQTRTTDRVNEIFSHVEDGSFLMGMELVQDVTASENVLLLSLDGLEAEIQSLKAASADYASRTEQASYRMTLTASLATVCVVMIIFFVVVKRQIVVPLHGLTASIKRFDPLKPDDLADDETENERLMRRSDELGMVARSLRELKETQRLQGNALTLAKEVAERADLAKTKFLAAASHDLRQPLHAMQMYIAALQQRARNKDVLAIIDDLQEVSSAASRLLNSLLDVSQLEAGAIKPSFETFPVQDLLDRVEISFAPVAARKGLAIRVVPSSLYLRSDPALMERIVGNLVSNAIRYTEKGKVLVGCRRRGRQIVVQVLDTGPGIPTHHRNAIFDDFFQISNEERDRSKGIGLGLAIVRRLSERLYHRIELHSSVGSGSCFGIVADRALTKPRKATANEAFDSLNNVHDISTLNVLLIEDDKYVSRSTSLLLQSWKCNVIILESTSDVLAFLQSPAWIPDIVIADFRLPGEFDGVEAINRIQLEFQVAVPGVVITGESDVSAISEIEKMGYIILRKPVRPAKLRRLLAFYGSGKLRQEAV